MAVSEEVRKRGGTLLNMCLKSKAAATARIESRFQSLSEKSEHSRLRQPAKSGFSDSLSAATGEYRCRDLEEVTEQVFGSEE